MPDPCRSDRHNPQSAGAANPLDIQLEGARLEVRDSATCVDGWREVAEGRVTTKRRPGKPYALVLTHDIDALSLVELPLGRTLGGFLRRGLVDNLGRLLHGRLSADEYGRSVRAVLGYVPAKLGHGVDVWARSVGIMLDIERAHSVRSTLFFIPVCGEPGFGLQHGHRAPANRAAHYHLTDYREMLSELVREGWEVGVHGLDAWRSVEDARRELAEFKRACPGQERVGIRMHWLYTREGMWPDLEEAGYAYDATFGWNDRIGFPDGRYWPFRGTSSRRLMILPLNIQDVALLARKYGNLTVEQAWREIENVLEEAGRNSAVVTVLWHNTSFVAPRFWGALYERLLERAATDGAEVLTAAQAVERFVCD